LSTQDLTLSLLLTSVTSTFSFYRGTNSDERPNHIHGLFTPPTATTTTGESYGYFVSIEIKYPAIGCDKMIIHGFKSLFKCQNLYSNARTCFNVFITIPICNIDGIYISLFVK
jgi:hypothetical protein